MHQAYNPNQLFDSMLEHMQLKNDAQLCRALQLAPPLVSKMRHHRLPVSGAVLLRLHEVTGISLQTLRKLMGDRRSKFRFSNTYGRPQA